MTTKAMLTIIKTSQFLIRTNYQHFSHFLRSPIINHLKNFTKPWIDTPLSSFNSENHDSHHHYSIPKDCSSTLTAVHHTHSSQITRVKKTSRSPIIHIHRTKKKKNKEELIQAETLTYLARDTSSTPILLR